jgi:hypothetical protein
MLKPDLIYLFSLSSMSSSSREDEVSCLSVDSMIAKSIASAEVGRVGEAPNPDVTPVESSETTDGGVRELTSSESLHRAASNDFLHYFSSWQLLR